MRGQKVDRSDGGPMGRSSLTSSTSSEDFSSLEWKRSNSQVLISYDNRHDDRVLQDTALEVAAEDDEFFYVRRAVSDPDGDAGLRGEKSTPETLTTACHAASWLARS